MRANVLRHARVRSRYPFPGVVDLLDEGASLVLHQLTLLGHVRKCPRKAHLVVMKAKSEHWYECPPDQRSPSGLLPLECVNGVLHPVDMPFLFPRLRPKNAQAPSAHDTV